jgi:hypothetical protein
MPHLDATAGRFVRARAGDADQPSESSPLVVAAAMFVVIAIVVVVGRSMIHLAFSPLTHTVTTPVPVGLGQGSPIYRLTNKHLFSERNLFGPALCCVSCR